MFQTSIKKKQKKTPYRNNSVILISFDAKLLKDELFVVVTDVEVTSFEISSVVEYAFSCWC